MRTKETAYGYVEDGKVFLKSYLDFPERQIGVVKETDEAAIEYFEKRYENAKEKVEELKKLVAEAENKGSYLMKLIHMRTYLAEFKGLGDFPALFEVLDEVEEELQGLVAQNRVKNLQIKQELIKEAEAIMNDTNWEDTTKKLQDIKQRWIKTGPTSKEHTEALENSFNEAFKTFFNNRKQYYKKRNNEIKEKISAYKRIIDQANKLKYSDKFDDSAVTLKKLQAEWKKVGKVPHSKMKKLWDRFKKINNDFFYRYKQYKSGASVIKPFNPSEASKIRQENLCKKAESLVGINTQEALGEAKSLLMQWKKTTSNPKYIDKALARRFRLVCDRIFEEGYLIRLIKHKYPDFDNKPPFQQYKIKTSYMRELIRREEQSIHLAETGKLPEEKQNKYNLSTQKRKLQVKKIMLYEFEEGLKNF
ncbi:MAG: DUF349 domain-containing protein [Thermonemataceae bacterium]